MNEYWAAIRTRFTERAAKPLSRRELALCVFLMALYFATGRWGLTLALIQRNVTAFWLPAGIALAAFLLLGYRVWLVILVASFIIDGTYSGRVTTAVGVAGANILEGFVGCYLVTRFAGGAKAFDTAEGVFKFIFYACVVSTAIGATVGVAVLHLTGLVTWSRCGYVWLTWCLADSVGILVIAPFLILLFDRPHHPLDRREMVELTVLTVGLILIGVIVFGPLSLSLNQSHLVRAAMCIPFLIWAGFRFCQLETAGLTAILFGTAMWGTLRGYGYFVTADLNLSLLTLDMFIGVIGTMSMVVAALVAERREIETNLLGIQSLLQASIEEKTRELAAAVEALRMKEIERRDRRSTPPDGQDELRAGTYDRQDPHALPAREFSRATDFFSGKRT